MHGPNKSQDMHTHWQYSSTNHTSANPFIKDTPQCTQNQNAKLKILRNTLQENLSYHNSLSNINIQTNVAETYAYILPKHENYELQYGHPVVLYD